MEFWLFEILIFFLFPLYFTQSLSYTADSNIFYSWLAFSLLSTECKWLHISSQQWTLLPKNKDVWQKVQQAANLSWDRSSCNMYLNRKVGESRGYKDVIIFVNSKYRDGMIVVNFGCWPDPCFRLLKSSFLCIVKFPSNKAFSINLRIKSYYQTH